MAIALIASSAAVLALATRIDITSAGRPELLALDAKNKVKPPDCSEFSIGVAQRTMSTTSRDLGGDYAAVRGGSYAEIVALRREEARATLFMCNVAVDRCIYEREALERVGQEYGADRYYNIEAQRELAACEARR